VAENWMILVISPFRLLITMGTRFDWIKFVETIQNIMKTVKSTIIALLGTTFLISCQKEKVVKSNFSMSDSELINAKNGGGANINILSGLKAHYPFSSNANDASGNGNNGTVTNATLTSDRFGKRNQAYLFNGTSSFIDIKNKFFDNGWTNSTISFWAYPTSYGPWPLNTGHLSILNTDPHHGTEISYDFNGSRKFNVCKNIFPENNNWDILFEDNFNYEIDVLNKWCFIAIVKSGTNYQYYINGNLDKTVTPLEAPLPYLCSLRIGAASYAASGAEFFKGKLDEFRFYDRALSAAEIKYLMSK
jgi:hypothetical protein